MSSDTQFDWMNGVVYEPAPTIIVSPPPARGWGGYAFLTLCGVAVIAGAAWGLLG